MKRLDLFSLGAVLVILGGLYDSALYYWYYLPSIGKAFDWVVSVPDVVDFYRKPYSWIGLVAVVIGLLLVFMPRFRGRCGR